jgi:hypothetical protein
MRKAYRLSLLLLLIFTACQKKEIQIPDDLIAKDSMVGILLDIHLADAGIKSLPADSAAWNTSAYYNFIYKKHNITDSLFQKSLTFYTNNPELLEQIYIKVGEEMSKQEASLYKKP